MLFRSGLQHPQFVHRPNGLAMMIRIRRRKTKSFLQARISDFPCISVFPFPYKAAPFGLQRVYTFNFTFFIKAQNTITNKIEKLSSKMAFEFGLCLVEFESITLVSVCTNCNNLFI